MPSKTPGNKLMFCCVLSRQIFSNAKHEMKTQESGKIRQIQWKKFFTFLTKISVILCWWLSSLLFAAVISYILKWIKKWKKCWFMSKIYIRWNVCWQWTDFSFAGSDLIFYKKIFLMKFGIVVYSYFHFEHNSWVWVYIPRRQQSVNLILDCSQHQRKTSQNNPIKVSQKEGKVQGSQIENDNEIVFVSLRSRNSNDWRVSTANYSSFHFSSLIIPCFRAEFISWNLKPKRKISFSFFASLQMKWSENMKIMKITTWRIRNSNVFQLLLRSEEKSSEKSEQFSWLSDDRGGTMSSVILSNFLNFLLDTKECVFLRLVFLYNTTNLL